MAWGKAKTILIILFSILNVFLFASILYSNSSLGLSSDYMKYVGKLLESKNVKLDAAVPSFHQDSGKIVYEDSVIDEQKVVGFLLGSSGGISEKSDPLGKKWTDDSKTLEIGNNVIRYTDQSPAQSMTIHDKKKLINELKPWFVGLGIDQGDYAADIYIAQDDSAYIKFVKKYKGQLLFDVYADFTITSSGVRTMNVMLRNPINAIMPEEILPAYQVIVVGGVPDYSTIKEISFGYKKILEGELNDSPVWRFRFADGHDDFYNAYTGEKLNGQDK